jgi:RNA polymerase sigma factor (sigma-70 family)
VISPDVNDEGALAQSVIRARAGDRGALEQVVAAVRDDVYRLALRMAGHPQDAEDACQEILIKIITHLEGFRGEASVRTWAYRIAVRHMLDRQKSRVETMTQSFERFGADLLDGLAAEPDPDPVMTREVKLGCTLAMLTCLDREHRATYVLCDVFDLAPQAAAAILETSEQTMRQRLSRARRALEAFTTSYCGLVAKEAPCHCSRRVARAEQLGRVHRGQRTLAHEAEVARQEMESLHTVAALMRAHPDYRAPQHVVDTVTRVLASELTVLRPISA